jgi:STE24 endopeptidase
VSEDARGAAPRRPNPRSALLTGMVAALVLVVLAAGAFLLWPTDVPDDLALSGDAVSTQRGVIEIDAPEGRCWAATVNGARRQGCGPTSIEVEIGESLAVTVSKAEPGTWAPVHSLTVDGRQVRWVNGEGGFNYEVDTPAEVFPEEVVAKAEDYERVLYALWILSQWALIATLVLYARRGAAFARESSAGPIGTGMLLGMLGLAIVWLVNLPFRIAAHWWARRHDLTELDYVSWIFEDWFILGAQFLSLCLALLIAMGLARRLGDHWWLPGAAVFVAIAALFTFVAPYLDFTTERLEDAELQATAERYESALGLGDVPIRVELVSEDSELANAYAYGIGPSRRVVLWDTLLEEPFDASEQKLVLAHELAHHSQNHLPEGIGWFALFAIPGAFVLMLATRARGGMGTPEAVPLALVVAVLFQFATAPLSNWISRRMEAEADWKALEVTRDRYALEGVMRAFAETSLSDPDPPGWAQLMTGTHPALEDRVAMARAWAQREGD